VLIATAPRRQPLGLHRRCGGKDSTYQVVRMLQLGLNPLCVTSSTCDLSPLGRQNLQNLKRLGVDHIEVSPNPLVRAKLNRVGLTQVGDISWPEHVGIFTIPVRAPQFNVPLIVWARTRRTNTGLRGREQRAQPPLARRVRRPAGHARVRSDWPGRH
jgi:hypothetical protein